MTNPFSPDFLAALAEKDTKAPQKPPSADQPPTSTSDAAATQPIPASPRDGIQIIKNSQGQVLQKIPLKNGVVDGEMQSFHPETGALTHQMTYENGLLHGDVLVFEPHTQNVAQRIPFAKGKKQGLGIFYQKGAKVSEIPFESDAMSGEARFYGPNEALQTIALYSNNQLNGPFVSFNPENQRIREANYKDGLLDGPTKTFYPGGALLEEALYKNNKVQEQLVRYYENGTPMQKVFYNQDGRPIREQSFSPKGAVVKDINIPPNPEKK